MTVTVVTVNLNGAKHLHDCLSSLLAQTHPVIEIIVVDNGSDDNSEQICSDYDVSFIKAGGNVGLARGYNLGASLAQGEHIFFVNNDMYFEPNCVEELVMAMERAGPDCFATDPLQYSWDRSRIIHYRCFLRSFERPIEFFSNVFSLAPGLKRVYGTATTDTPVPFASGGSMLVRKLHFDSLGGFDAMFFLDWEDVDLCWRANRRGWRSVFVPTARLRHRWGGTTKNFRSGFSAMTLKMGVSQQYNMMRFAMKNYDMLNALIFPLSRLAAVPLFLCRLKPEAALCSILAFGKVVSTLPGIMSERRRLNREALVSNSALFARFRNDGEEHSLIWPAEQESNGGVLVC